MHVAITGAAGNVGREALDAFESHDDYRVTAFTHHEHDDVDSEILDITDVDAVSDAFADVDTVIHLAAASSPDADWDAVVETNIRGTQCVYEAAVEQDVARVVFASSNHAVGNANAADLTTTETHVERPETVMPSDATRPDSFYGVSKVAGEGLGSYYADHHGIESVAVRIGWFMTPEKLRETQSSEPEHAKFARAMWLSPRDCRSILRAAVDADVDANPLVVHAVSRNDERTLSLGTARHELGYRPRDNATELLESE